MTRPNGRTRPALLTAVLALALALVGAAALPSPASASAPAASGTGCVSGSHVLVFGNYFVDFTYTDGSAPATCYFDRQYDWIVAARNAVVRAENGQSNYRTIDVYDPGYGQMDVKATFSGPGGAVNTSAVQPGGESGWQDYFEVPCSVSARQSRRGFESDAWKLYLHEVGEAYRRNIAFTELSTVEGNAVAYAPNCPNSPLS